MLNAQSIGVPTSFAQEKSEHLQTELIGQAKTAQATLDHYFHQQTQLISNQCLEQIKSIDEWQQQKPKRRAELYDMLGLQPLPAKTKLNPVITGGAEAEGVIVENIYFESSPGLFVTGNLYRPSEQEKPLPAILYVCGHGRVKENGISYGNKTHYQHHGAWFAKNGYVCLTIDTIQLGELEGIHHGTYREKMWWWNNRGYTPAGVEAWNCIRSLDYLETRSEVDAERIGVTGRSGGGAYSWWIAAIDERVKVAVPVAGITSMKNHVVDGCIEGHCDCMFMLNTYRWDYPMVAALVAPRPLLISNTDKDRIFPLDGVVDVHQKVAKIYELYNASDKLGLHITEGPHQDTQELRIHAFRWFNRHLRGTDELIDVPATKLFTPKQLKVFDQLPKNQRVTDIHETFIPIASDASLPVNHGELAVKGDQWTKKLRAKTFSGWSEVDEKTELSLLSSVDLNGIKVERMAYQVDAPFQLPIYKLSHDSASPNHTKIRILTNKEWERYSPILLTSLEGNPELSSQINSSLAAIKGELSEHRLVLIAPRGVGPTDWRADERKQTHIRRRFMQLGQTLAGMQIYDIIAALKLIRELPDVRKSEIQLTATGEAATLALYASIFESGFDRLSLENLAPNHRLSPDLFNVSRITTLPQIAMLAAARNKHLELRFSDKDYLMQWQSSLNGNPLARECISIE